MNYLFYLDLEAMEIQPLTQKRRFQTERKPLKIQIPVTHFE